MQWFLLKNIDGFENGKLDASIQKTIREIHYYSFYIEITIELVHNPETSWVLLNF